MKFSCEKSLLLDGITTVQKAVDSKGTLPALKGIYLQAKSGHLIFAATNLEIGIETRIEIIDCEEDGTTVIPAKLFSDIVRKLPNGLVACQTQDNKLLLKYRDSELEITTMEPEEFPIIPETETEIATLSAEILREGIRRTVIVTEDSNSSRPIFSGLYLSLTNGGMEIVGTDTRRLALFAHAIESNVKFATVIPAKAAAEVLRLASDGPIGIKQSGSLLSFEWGETRIVARTIEGQFPDYRQVIPEKSATRICLNVEELRGAIGRANTMAEGEYRIIRLSGDSGNFQVSSIGNQSGRLHERIQAETEGETVKVSVNSGFILTALSALKSENVCVEFNGETKPIVMREEGYTHVVLPTRVN